MQTQQRTAYGRRRVIDIRQVSDCAQDKSGSSARQTTVFILIVGFPTKQLGNREPVAVGNVSRESASPRG